MIPQIFSDRIKGAAHHREGGVGRTGRGRRGRAGGRNAAGGIAAKAAPLDLPVPEDVGGVDIHRERRARARMRGMWRDRTEPDACGYRKEKEEGEGGQV
jgi:hypothetical protein